MISAKTSPATDDVTAVFLHANILATATGPVLCVVMDEDLAVELDYAFPASWAGIRACWSPCAFGHYAWGPT